MKPTKALKEASTTTKTKTRAHPPASEMVVAAITALNDRKGSSLASIKKYIVANYQCDIDKVAFFIRKFLKSAVEKETLIQTKGTGASGSFKLPKPEKASKKKSEKKQPRDKSVSSKKSAKTAEMKDTEKKKIPKSAIAKKPRSAKSQVATKSPVKRTGKAPTTKPKSPSAKKAAKAKKVAKK